jgi:uncharacterized SAM-binding protein YcdF (DUF218 family)
VKATPSADSSQKLWGILSRKERWGLSWRGRLLVTSVLLAAACLVILNVHSFLVVTHRVNANVLVVEGWIETNAIRAGAEEFKSGHYERVFTTGGPVNGSGGYVNDYNTSASVGADALKKAGVPGESLQMVPSHVIGQDRTYSSAVALREWFHEHNMPVSSINVLTEDTHARRTRLLFQAAFGDRVEVGIISVRNPDYKPNQWWCYSEGVKDVLSEGIAYLYAKFFFYPSDSSHDKRTGRPSQAAR